MDTISLLDIVRITEDIPDSGVRRGMLGTVVEDFSTDGFLVEFSDTSGRTIETVAVTPGQLCLHKARTQMPSTPKIAVSA